MKKIMLFMILLIPFIVFAYSRGDVDGDNIVNFKDYAMVRKHILKDSLLKGNELARADADSNGVINFRDYAVIRKIILKEDISSLISNPTSTSTPKLTPKPTVTPTPKPTSTATPKPTSTPVLKEEDRICESVKNNSSIDYKSFASLKKDNDDYYAIKAAHDCANKYNKPVVVTKGEYHIYKKNNDTITVQTNTDFNNSTIYIHDEYSDIYKYMSTNIYTIAPNTSNKCTTKKMNNFSNAFKSLVPSTGKYFVYIEEQNGTKVYSRRHNCSNGGTCQEQEKRDPYRVYNGVIQDPIVWDYNNSTIKYTVCPIPSNQLVIKNANFKTIIRVDCSKCVNDSGETVFKKRGIAVRRSNTKVYNINHSYVNQKYEKAYEIHHKYYGFLSASVVGDVTFEKCNIDAMVYKISGSNSIGSTYDMNLGRVANITLNKVKIYDSKNQMKSTDYWSALTTYECKNMLISDSYLNTISDHMNIYNLTVKNTTIGARGLIIAGTGDRNDNKITLDNVTWKYTSFLIKLRGDFGITWNGSITIKNSKVEKATSSTLNVLYTENMSDNMKKGVVYHNPIYNPTKLTINGLTINSSNVTKLQMYNCSKNEFKNYYLTHFQRKNNKNAETVISKKNISGNGSSNIANYSN